MQATAQLIDIDSILPNPNNPRTIKDSKYAQLVNSIRKFPEMLNVRPIVVNSNMIVLGGNMRLKACKDAGLTHVPVIVAENFNEQQQREFIIKDNVGYGEWAWDMLAVDWNVEELATWGLDMPAFESEDMDLEKFFEDDDKQRSSAFRITLEFTESDYGKVIAAFDKHGGSRESVVCKLLGV